MIHIHEYPICEFSDQPKGVICADDHFEKLLPDTCVITFFRKELEAFVAENQLPIVAYSHCEVMDFPIYLYEREGLSLAITLPMQCSGGAAGTLEDLRGMGCKRFIICGGAGCITGKMGVGEILLPTSAVRDEGASYHYLPPSREVAAPGDMLQRTAALLEAWHVPFALGKTWTTDAFYRETPEMVQHRRAEGCITVEMETAAFYAVARFYGLELVQLLYAGDDVSGDAWDDRGWNTRQSIRANLIELCIRLAKEL